MNGCALRQPQSVWVTVVACTLTSTSSSFGYRPLDVVDAQHLRRSIPVVHDRSHAAHVLSSVRCRRWIGPPWLQALPARKSSAGLPPAEPGRARRPVGITHPSSATMLRRKFAASSCTPQIASYTVRSSAIVKVVPTKAVAMPETSSSTRARSTASRRIRRWSKASSTLPVEHVGHGDQRGVRGIGARGDRSDIAKHREVRDRDDVHARVALGIAVCAELLQHGSGVDAGLLAQLTLRRAVERLCRPLEAAGYRPHAFERRLTAADEEHVQGPLRTW